MSGPVFPRFFLWDYLKDVCAYNPHTTKKLQQNSEDVFEYTKRLPVVSRQTITRVNIPYNVAGNHVQHL